jgi:amidase
MPSREDVRELAAELGFDLTEEEVEDYTEMLAGKMAVYELIEELPSPRRRIEFTDRDPGYRPGEDEDPHNAFVTKCRVAGAGNGPLAGYEVAVKDNVAVAGVEMTCGSKVFEGFVPGFDATVVERLLAAGASITGKTNLDEMAVSGSGELTATGPIFNPRDDDYLPGGSSGGSAVAVVRGDADVALGTDQAGSIRTPSSWTGCVGHKPTYGLVPYTGCVAGGPTYDHVGPMGTTVEDCARVLEVIAGEDPLDPRPAPPEAGGYVDGLGDGVDGLTVGVLKEGFDAEHSEAVVDDTVREAAGRFGDLGAEVREVSVPWHDDGILVWLGVAWEESEVLLRDNGLGYYLQGYYPTQLLTEFAKAQRARGDEFAPTVKLKKLLGSYVREHYHGYYHAKAQNLRRELRAAYDEALEDVDLLVMPTTPTRAFEAEEELTRQEIVARAQGKEGRTRNTMPFNMTGHPALSLPCGEADGLPVGMMLVGRRFDDATVLRAGHALETSGLADG